MSLKSFVFFVTFVVCSSPAWANITPPPYTPPPPNWKPFPDDPSPAASNGSAHGGGQRNGSSAPQAGSSASDSAMGVSSAAVAVIPRPHVLGTAPEISKFWLLMLAVLSVGTVLVGAQLVIGDAKVLESRSLGV